MKNIKFLTACLKKPIECMHSPFILITLLLIAYLSYIKELSITKTCINLQSAKVYKSRLEKACLALNSSLKSSANYKADPL